MFRKTAVLAAFIAGMQIAGAAAAAERGGATAFSPVPGVTTAGTNVAAAIIAGRGTLPDVVNASCIEEGKTCVKHGTPCCGTFQCKGNFPNTTCQ
jgi:hypothetical protein